MKVKDFLDTDYKDYSKYVLYQRAIPSIVDGFKPVNRKIMFVAGKNAKSSKVKVSSLSGLLAAESNYHHGEASANEAIIKMAQPFSNNEALLEAHGSFGSRLVQEAAAPRYIFVKKSKTFEKYFIDNDILESQPDPEDPEPLYYLPTIPWVLINGIRGIAVGFATEIQPRNPEEVTDLCIRYMKGEDIDGYDLDPWYNDFTGSIVRNSNNGWDCTGLFTIQSQTKLQITELPIGYDREKYIQVLNKLQDNNSIVSYSEKHKDGKFHFDVILKRTYKPTKAKVIRDFKLKKTLNENITLLDENMNLVTYDNPIDVIKHFCDFRLTKYTDRYNWYIKRDEEEMKKLMAIRDFIVNVVDGMVTLKNKTKKQLTSEIKRVKMWAKYVDILVNLPIYKFCKDEIKVLTDRINKLRKDINAWNKVDITEEYLNDLNKL